MSAVRKAIVTVGDGGFASALDIALPTFEHYAERWGYEIHIGSGESAGDRPGAWAKVRLLRETLDDYEHVVWIDADAIVVDPSRDIADELRDGDFQALVEEYNGPHRYPNTGVWVLRGERAKQFLDRVWEGEEFTDHLYWEQASVADLLGYEIAPWVKGSILIGFSGRARESDWMEGTRWISRRWNNLVFWSPVEHPRINHYAGVWPLERRLSRQRQDAEALPFARPRVPEASPVGAAAASSEPAGDLDAAADWEERRQVVERELRELALDGERFALADEENWREPLGLTERAFPFPERHGEWWGPPPNDLAAIVEVERARRSGARALVFAWPALWWLDHYSELSDHLRTSYPCIHESDSVVAFDLGGAATPDGNGRPLERVVQSGPFAGMLYPAEPNDMDDVRVRARREGAEPDGLLAAVERLISTDFRTIICLGASDGYYPVGLAVRSPHATVYAFDSDYPRRRRCRALADLNAVSEQLIHQRRCTHALLDRVAAWSTAIVALEGSEPELLSPEAVPGLRTCTLLVRVDDDSVLARYATTHTVQSTRRGVAWLEPRVESRLTRRNGKRSASKAIVTLAEGALVEALELTMPTFDAYASRHGYEILVGESPGAVDRTGQWAKLPVIRSALEQFDFVLWLDADVVITNPDADIAAELDQAHFQGFVEQSALGVKMPNTGVWPLRSDERSDTFLTAVWHAAEFVDHAWADQAAVAYLLGYDLPAILPPPWDVKGALARPVSRVRKSAFMEGTTLLAPEWNNLVVWEPVEPRRFEHYAGLWPIELRLDQMATAVGHWTRPVRATKPDEPVRQSSPAAPTQDWTERLRAADMEIERVVPTDESFVLVDEDRCRAMIRAGQRAIPFSERDGDYWGPPANDACAIVELERLRAEGAGFAIFLWPAFWWLDHYTGLARHLRSTAECVAEDDHLVVFDLRHGRPGLPDGLRHRVVRSGPFAGMVYPDAALEDPLPTLASKLDGSYEQGIHPILAAAVSGGHKLFVNVGLDGGHYAVGILLRSPWAQVWAFDSRVLERGACRQLARENGVRAGTHGDMDRVILHPYCEHAWLDAIADRSGKREPFVISTDEHQLGLFDPEAAPALRGYTMLLKLGEYTPAGFVEGVVGGFAASHDVSLVEADARPDLPSPVGRAKWAYLRPHEPSSGELY